MIGHTLWFDVGFKRYTTYIKNLFNRIWLWFDVGFKRYTTLFPFPLFPTGCGLM